MKRTMPRAVGAILAVIAVLVSGQVTTQAPSVEKRLSVYSPLASFSVNVSEREKLDYLPLLEMFSQLGQASLRVDGKRVFLQVNDAAAEFEAGRDYARVGRAKVDLGGPAVFEGGKLLAPVHSAAMLVTRLLHEKADFHETARRLFLENTVTLLAPELKNNNGSTLVLTFPGRVNPAIAAEGNKLHIVFTRDAVVSGASQIAFNDKLIFSLNYSEANGSAEVTVNGSAPLLASFAEGGRSVVIGAAPAPQSTAGAGATAGSSKPAGNAAQQAAGAGANPSAVAGAAKNAGAAQATPSQQSAPKWLVMIDAAHGGDDPGARLSEKLAEKDVTLAVARRLRQELQNKGISCVLSRDADVTLSAEQRAVAANSDRVAVYIAIHAGEPGTGARIYTAWMPPAAEPAKSQTSAASSAFIPWERAQEPHVSSSKELARAVVGAIAALDLPARSSSAALTPLNSVSATAVAIEIAPPDRNSVESLTSARYQENLSSAIAQAVANFTAQMQNAGEDAR